jgi:hypothetical protein
MAEKLQIQLIKQEITKLQTEFTLLELLAGWKKLLSAAGGGAAVATIMTWVADF